MSLLVVKVRWMDCECSCLAALLQSSSCEYWVLRRCHCSGRAIISVPRVIRNSYPLSPTLFPEPLVQCECSQHLLMRNTCGGGCLIFSFMAFLSPLSLHKRPSLRCFHRWYWLKVSGRKSKHGNGVKMHRSKWNFRITCVVVYLTFALLEFQFQYPHPDEMPGCGLLI